MKKIIAISGKQFSGKDTLAKIILKELTNFKRIGLGDGIKIEYGEKTGLTVEEIEKNKAQYRADLQKLGNERRSQDADYWIKKVIALPQDIIVPDIRVQKEYDYFKEAGAFMIRVNATEASRSQRGTLAAVNDITETALDEITTWNCIISNDSTAQDFEQKAQDIISQIKQYFSL